MLTEDVLIKCFGAAILLLIGEVVMFAFLNRKHFREVESSYNTSEIDSHGIGARRV